MPDLLARQLLEHIAVEAYGPVQVFEADVLVGRVSAACPISCVAGRSQTWNPNMAAQRSQQWKCASHDGRHRGPLAGERPGNFNYALHERCFERRQHRFCCPQGCNPHVVIPFSRQVSAQFRQDVMWVLLGDEAEVDLAAHTSRSISFYVYYALPA